MPLSFEDLRVRRFTPAQSHERVDWIDVARGIGILLVVFQHVLRGVVHAGLFPFTPQWQMEDFFVHTFHMPLFFFLAGLHVESSLAKGKKRFLGTKLWTILYPYFLWSLLQGGLQIALSKYINNAPAAKELASIPWRPLDQFWFLYVLMLCHLLATLIVPRLRPMLLPIAAAGCAISILAPVSSSLVEQCLFMFLFYAFGILLADWVKQPISLAFTPRLIFFCALTLAFCTAAYLAFKGGNSYWDSWQSLPANLLGITVAIWVAKQLRGTIASVLIVLGKYSMAIYLMHVMAAAGTRVGLKLLHLHQPAAYLVIATTAGLVLPLLAEGILRKLHLQVALGLSPLPNASRTQKMKTPAAA